MRPTLTIDEKTRSWLDRHQWFLDNHRLPAEAASYVFKCGYLAGLESGQSKMMQRLSELVGPIETTRPRPPEEQG